MATLLAFGSNGSGQLGIGHYEDVREPKRCIGIPESETVAKITGGGNHAAVLTKDGHVYLAGTGQFGEQHRKRLAVEDSQEKKWAVFTQPAILAKHVWRDVACGWSFTLLVSDQGKIYGLGSASFGELSQVKEAVNELTEIDDRLTGITSVACGWRHAVALNRAGEVFGWGWGRHGQLGNSVAPQKPDIRRPHHIRMPQPIVQIACGHLHTLLLGKDGTVYGFGSNKYGQLGDVNDNMVIFGPEAGVRSISAGWHHSAALCANQAFLIWGRNDHGQTEKGLETAESVTCGSEHTLAISDKQLWAWGWNEHGNCTSHMETVSNPFQITSLKGRISCIGAGCATSWVALDASSLPNDESI